MFSVRLCVAATACFLGMSLWGSSSAFADCIDFESCPMSVSGTGGAGLVSVPASCQDNANYTFYGVGGSPPRDWAFTSSTGLAYTDISLSAQGYSIDYSDDPVTTNLTFDLVHYNTSDVRISVYGTKLDGTKGYLTNSTGQTLQNVLYRPTGTPHGARYTVSINLGFTTAPFAFQSVDQIDISVPGGEVNVIKACVN